MLLPDDVLDYILSFLQLDYRSLEACSQSHPKFIPLVGRHLYVNITLCDTNFVVISGHDISTPEFLRRLSDNPHIANYVRNLEVSFACEITSPIRYLENITSILRMCSLLHKITLRYRSSSYFPSKWVSLPEDFRLAFLESLHIPSMKAVCIMFVSGFPLTALSSSKSVKSVTLRGWEPSTDLITETLPYTLLEDLAIQHLNPRKGDLQAIIGWVQPSNLRSLEVSRLYKSHDFQDLSNFFSSCSKTLTNLSLHFALEFQTPYWFEIGHTDSLDQLQSAIPLSLSCLISLENLTISSDVEFHYSSWSDNIRLQSAIIKIAQLLETALPLHRLTLAFHFHHDSNLRIPYDPNILWSPLVSLISKSRASCTNLHVRNSTTVSGAISPARILSSLTQCTNLMQMVDQGVLVITSVDASTE